MKAKPKNNSKTAKPTKAKKHGKDMSLAKSVSVMTPTNKNVLVVGMNQLLKFPVGADERQRCDERRIQVLRDNFANVYSLAPGRHQTHDESVHVAGKLHLRAVKRTVEILRGNKLDYILLDYVHLTKTYYCEHLLIGDTLTKEPNAGANLRKYVQGLDVAGALNPDCKLQFARVGAKYSRYDSTIKNLSGDFGKGLPIKVRMMIRSKIC